MQCFNGIPTREFSYRLIKWLVNRIKENMYLKALSKSGMRKINQMDGFQFEVYLRALLKELGYKSSVTSNSHDFGADLVMKKDGKRVVIQAKRYSYRNRVGIDAIQQVYASKPYYKAHECWVMTNSFFTNPAKKLAKVYDVKLFDCFELIKLIRRIQHKMFWKMLNLKLLGVHVVMEF